MERLLAVGRTGQALFLIILTLLSIAAWQLLPALQINRNDDKLISPSDPGWDKLHRMEADFGAEETVLIYLRDADLWSPERLKQLQKLTFDLEDSPAITSVSSLLSATNIRDKGDFVVAEPLVDIVPRTRTGIAEIKDDAMYSPIMRHSVISDDALSTTISLGYPRDPHNPNLSTEIYEVI